jgi:hypothetical protein
LGWPSRVGLSNGTEEESGWTQGWAKVPSSISPCPIPQRPTKLQALSFTLNQQSHSTDGKYAPASGSAHYIEYGGHGFDAAYAFKIGLKRFHNIRIADAASLAEFQTSAGSRASNFASTRGAGGSCSAQSKQTGSPLMRITVWVIQPTQSAGSPKEYFIATPLLQRVCDFVKETKMAYPGWDNPLSGTDAKVFRAEGSSRRKCASGGQELR